MRKTLLTLAVFALAASTASATLMIDDFTTLGTGLGTISDPIVNCAGGSASTTNTMGSNRIGDRTMMVTNQGGTGCVDLRSNVFGQYLAYSSVANSQPGITMVEWTVANQGAATNNAFLAESLLSFLLSYDAANNGNITLFWQVCAGGLGGTCAESTFVRTPPALPGGVGGTPTQNISLNLLGFTNYAALAAALAGTNLDTVKLTITADPDVDASVDLLRFDTPEPSTFVLLGSALVGIAMLRRRRRV